MNNEVNLKSLVASMLKRGIWLIMVPLICASLMFAFLSFENSTYTAKVDFLSKNNSKNVDYNTSALQNAKIKEIDNYIKILTSDVALTRVSQQLSTKYGLSASVSEIRSMITTTVPEGTSVMSISVTSNSPYMAESICKSLSDIFIPIIEESYEKEDILECLSREFKSVENKPDIIKPTVIAAAIGFLVTFSICIFLAYNDKTVRTAEEARKLLEIPVIGVIPE